jgi:hypothetical protein
MLSPDQYKAGPSALLIALAQIALPVVGVESFSEFKPTVFDEPMVGLN